MTKFDWNNKLYKVAFLKLYCLIGKFILQILTSHDFFLSYISVFVKGIQINRMEFKNLKFF